MAKQILIDSYFGMVRTAIAEDQELVDYYEESPEQGRNKGNIYRGVVKKVDAPIQAAFVKFAGGRDGFLPLRDVAAGKLPKPGDTVLVQVVKDEVGDKGAALTAKLSLSGRYLVYIPERDGEGGISSKITDEERAALKQALEELRIPDGASMILRTAASDKSVAELQADLDRLIETHREILAKFDQGKEPALLFREAPPALRYLREYYTEDIERIWVNQEDVQDQCRQFFYLYEPKSASKVELSQDGPLLFQRLGLEPDVEKLSSRKVTLPSGANIVIDQAEALVAIDVNSAKAGGRIEEPKEKAKGRGKGRGSRSGGDLEATVFAVNLEAAGEIARQLRLRDLGGIIIVDFIDMEQEKHRRQIEDAMKKALSRDKAKVKVFEISPLGIMQISRQRLRKAGHQFSRPACDACQGRGWHPSPSAGALTALRRLEERLHGKKAGQSLSVSVPYPVANKLMNEFREHVIAMEKRYGCTLRLNALPTATGEISLAVLGGGEGGQVREGRAAEREAPAGRDRQAAPRSGEARDERREGRNGGRNAPTDGRKDKRAGEREPQAAQAAGETRAAGDRNAPAPGQARRGRGGRNVRDGRGRGQNDGRPGIPGAADALPELSAPPSGDADSIPDAAPVAMAAAIAEIVNTEVTHAEGAAPGPAGRARRSRRGGRGRGRGRPEGASEAAAAKSTGEIPKGAVADAPALGRTQARQVPENAEPAGPAGHAGPVKAGGRPRSRRRGGRGKQSGGESRPANPEA
jgi:ribonuclease E